MTLKDGPASYGPHLSFAWDAEVAGRAIEGADAVISVLPAVLGAEPEYFEATRTIVETAELAGIRRVIVTAKGMS